MKSFLLLFALVMLLIAALVVILVALYYRNAAFVKRSINHRISELGYQLISINSISRPKHSESKFEFAMISPYGSRILSTEYRQVIYKDADGGEASCHVKIRCFMMFAYRVELQQ